MSSQQQISASEFIHDIRSGMTCADLLEKYKLSPNRIHRIFRGMIDGQIMTIDELAGCYTLYDDAVQQGIQSLRLLFRHVVNFALPIYEKEKPKTAGIVLDITEGGVKVKGIAAIKGESKNFTIPANKIFDVDRVEFEAQCRWVNIEESTGGFEITNISRGAPVELRKLIELVELSNQVEVTECEEPLPEKNDRRQQERYAVQFTLPVHEATKRQNKGTIVDVSEGGIRVQGLSVEPGDRKTLVIPAYHGFVTFDSIVVVAECRWIDTEGKPEEKNGGFKVIQLTPKNKLELAKLISTLLRAGEGLMERADIQGIKSPLDRGASDHKERHQIPRQLPEKGKAAAAKRHIRATEFLSDIRAGMDDASLMHKYGLSAHEVLKAVSKLMWQGLMTPTELEQRRSLAKTVYMPIYRCSSCKGISYMKLEKCPHCSAPMKNLNDKEPDFSR